MGNKKNNKKIYSKKKGKKEDPEILALKIELAEELGLLSKVEEGGWGSLSSFESGKIGGLISTRLQQKRESKKLKTGEKEEINEG
ncbi:MAG: hypothetical protein PWP31_910 [Clostridia bacterium]|nr:hypothetical protein [Clostridia bacterium]